MVAGATRDAGRLKASPLPVSPGSEHRMSMPTRPTQPIGVFDSGLGGLSVLRHIRERLPAEDLLYCADSAFVPYGDRPIHEIRERVFFIAGALLDQGAKALVLACNTATAAAIHELRHERPHLPIIGMEPGLKPAVTLSATGRVGILATAGTLRSDKFRHLIERYGAGHEVVMQACPGLVEQVEKGALDTVETAGLVAGYVRPLVAAGADALVLGCTHYPFLRALIEQAAGAGVAVIDTGPAVARQVENQLRHHGLLQPGHGPGTVRFLTSGDPCVQTEAISRLWGEPVEVGRLG